MKKINWEKVNKFIRNRNFIIAVCVFGLTMASIGFSYASFFSVKTNTTNQSITTGTLEVSYGSNSSSIQKTNMTSMSDEMGLAQTEASVIYIQNTGSLDSTYVMNIGYDMTNFKARTGYKDTDALTPIDYIMVAVYEYNGAGKEDTLIVEPISIAELPIVKYDESDPRNNRYSILFDTLGGTSSSNSTKTYKIKTWLSDKAIPAASYTYFYVNTEIVAEVQNAKMAYTLNGTLTDGTNPVGDAKIIFHNGSITTTSSSDGKFTLENLYPGIYNIEIVANDVTYEGNITIVEGTEKSVKGFGIAAVGGMTPTPSIYSWADSLGTTVGKIIRNQKIDSYSDEVSIRSAFSVNGYKITGAENENLTITLRLVTNSKDFFIELS